VNAHDCPPAARGGDSQEPALVILHWEQFWRAEQGPAKLTDKTFQTDARLDMGQALPAEPRWLGMDSLIVQRNQFSFGYRDATPDNGRSLCQTSLRYL
jgi:hypothetical protein